MFWAFFFRGDTLEWVPSQSVLEHLERYGLFFLSNLINSINRVIPSTETFYSNFGF